MKKLHTLILRTYLGPFVMTFFIALFIILMQFLWKYIDDMVGKGLEWYIIGELLFYAAATFVPMALPLAILLSSIMTMGSLGENYELVALKSSGISLTRIMWPLVLVSIFLGIAAFYFSNNVLPAANLKMMSLLYDVRQQRPAFNIMEGIYYKGIDNFVIKVEDKDPDGVTLRRIKIYNHAERRGNTDLTIAEWGSMEFTPDKRYLVMTLYDGANYHEPQNTDYYDRSRPLQRTHFSQQIRRFDLSGFALERTDEELFKNNFQMLNIAQLVYFQDSLNMELLKRYDAYFQTMIMRMYHYSMIDTTAKAGFFHQGHDQNETTFPEIKGSYVYDIALSNARNAKESTMFHHDEFRGRKRTLARHHIEFHRKFTLSFACLVLFMIGAPLGAIIRKGGFGLPVVISVLFFVIFHVASITGEKFAREGVIDAWQGMWMASLFLLPVGILLTIKATTDSALFDTDAYIKRFEKIQRKITGKA